MINLDYKMVNNIVGNKFMTKYIQNHHLMQRHRLLVMKGRVHVKLCGQLTQEKWYVTIKMI